MSHQDGFGNNRTQPTGSSEPDDDDDRMQKKSENDSHGHDGIKRQELRIHATCGIRLPQVTGVAIGILLTIASSSFIKSQLFGVTSTDSATFLLATFVIVAVALFAGYLPARRGARIDPMVAFRQE